MPEPRCIAQLTEEVLGAVETLRCPICLSMLPEGGKERCPACGSRLRARKRPIVLGDNTRIDARPLLLVERELEARIEAKTAGRFRQRRRAAKIARRIAALPPTISQGEAGAVAEPETPTPQPLQVSPIIVDLPAAAVHEVTSRPIVDHPAEPVEVPTEIVIDQTATSAPHARADVEGEPENGPQTNALEDVRFAEPIEQPAPVEPVVEAAPIVAASWQPRANSAWIDRVFSSAPGGRNQTVAWPRPRTPEAPIVDPAAESLAEQGSEAAG